MSSSVEGRRVGAAVIGYGYWGPNLARNFAETPGSRLAAVADLSPDRLAECQARYPGAYTSTDAAEVINHPDVEVVAVATPVSTHFRLAMAALEAGKHVLVEKPIAASSAEAEALIQAARARGLVLMVDHTFVYTGAVRKIREMSMAGELGDLYYYDAVRVNLGLFQSDVNVIWDLAAHDLSIIDVVMPGHPEAVQAYGASHVAGQPANIAYLTLVFPGNRLAHLHVNWLAPVKVRRTLIGGSHKMVVYDDLEPSEKVKVYDKGAGLISADPDVKYNTLVSYRVGDMYAPRLDTTEGLRNEVAHLMSCIKTGETPFTDGAAGLRVVRILEAADSSLRLGGRMVPVQLQDIARPA
jgi:predicted dehydrogenase